MHRARSGVLWASVVVLGSKFLNVATTLVLARVLTPSDFGVVAAASVVVAALGATADLGLSDAIVQSRAHRQRMASTAFFLMPFVGLTLYALAFLTAPTLADLLNSPESAGVIRIIALSLVISSLAVVPSALLEKDMRYRRRVVPDLVPALVYIGVTLYLATALDAGPYSLAIGQVVASVVALVLYWLAAGWRPSWCFDRTIARHLFSFGKHVLGGSLVVFVTTNLDNIFVSRVEGPAALGLYTLAYSIANLPATHVADVIGRVLLPSYVQMVDDPARLRRNYAKTLVVLVLVVSPLVAGMAATASNFVPLLLGDRWVGMVPVLVLLLAFGGIRSVAGATGSLLLAIGRPDIIFKTGLLGLALQAAFLFLCLVVLGLGVEGAALAVGASSMVTAGVISVLVGRLLHLRGRDVLRRAWPRLLPAPLMGAAVWALGLLLPMTFAALALQICAGAVAYVALLVLFNGKAEVQGTIEMLRR